MSFGQSLDPNTLLSGATGAETPATPIQHEEPQVGLPPLSLEEQGKLAVGLAKKTKEEDERGTHTRTELKKLAESQEPSDNRSAHERMNNAVWGTPGEQQAEAGGREHGAAAQAGLGGDPVAAKGLSHHASAEANMQMINDLARSLPHDSVGETAYRDFVAPVLNGTMDKYSADRVLATLAKLEDVQVAGAAMNPGFDLQKVEDKLAKLDLGNLRAMMGNMESLPEGTLASATQISGEARINADHHQAATRAAEADAARTLPPLGAHP